MWEPDKNNIQQMCLSKSISKQGYEQCNSQAQSLYDKKSSSTAQIGYFKESEYKYPMSIAMLYSIILVNLSELDPFLHTKFNTKLETKSQTRQVVKDIIHSFHLVLTPMYIIIIQVRSFLTPSDSFRQYLILCLVPVLRCLMPQDASAKSSSSRKAETAAVGCKAALATGVKRIIFILHLSFILFVFPGLSCLIFQPTFLVAMHFNINYNLNGHLKGLELLPSPAKQKTSFASPLPSTTPPPKMRLFRESHQRIDHSLVKILGGKQLGSSSSST